MTPTNLDTRARLTPIDIVFYGVAVFLIGILAGPVYQTLNDNAGALSTGQAYLFQMIFPAMIITILAVIYLTAVSGGTQ